MAVFYIFYRLFLIKDTWHRLNRIVLLSTALLSLLLPVCIITIHKTEVLPMPVAQLTQAVSSTPAKPSTPWWHIALMAVYASGVVFVLIRVLASALRVRGIIRHARKEVMADGTTVFVMPGNDPSFSWMGHIVISEADWNNRETAIINHEKAHVALRHSIDVLITDIIAALQWFNPAIWMLRIDLRAVHEYEADDTVLRAGADIRSYQYLLISKAAAMNGYTIANNFNHSILKNRIFMMEKETSTRRSLLRALYLLPLVCICLAVNAKTKVNYVYEDKNVTTSIVVDEIKMNGESLEGMTLDGILKMIPDAYVDDQGNITSQGHPVKRIVINGKILYKKEEPANAGTTITVTYNGYSSAGTGTLTITSDNDEVDPVTVNLTGNFVPQPIEPVTGLLRLHLLLVDQLKANIPDDNKHPDAYGYVLKFEPEGGETQESGKVKVDIQKTDCEVMGYYTLDQIDRDTNRGLTMDVLTADVQFDLTATNDMLNYYYLQGKENGYPELDKDYLSQLHRQEDFTYREMYTESFEFDQVFNSGKHHYFNSAAEPIIGTYGDATKFVSYAPSVTTWGVQRRYFELDGKDNTYGAPVWKTAVGKVEMSTQVKPVVERQTNNDNSVNWGSGEEAASLYMLDNVEAIGYLPPTNLTKVEFEPYMFRIFVESKNGLLRPYKVVEADPTNTDQPGEHLEAADGELTEADMKGPICVWSGYIKYDNDGLPTQDPENGVELSYQNINGPFTFHKDKVDRDAGYTPNGNPLGEWDKDSNNAMFGALDALAITGYDAQGKPILNNNITENDLKIFVRFYYSVKGELADHTPWTRAEGSRSGNGAESGGKAPDPATGVNEIVYHGEIVETIYYNVQGMMSDKPFEGVNIIVNRYSDGAISVTKVITK